MGIYAQSIEGLTFVRSLQEGFIPGQKNKQWVILDSFGVMVIDFRSDLMYNENPHSKNDLGVASVKYHLLCDERSIIRKEHMDFAYFGFIDAIWAVVIQPKF